MRQPSPDWIKLKYTLKLKKKFKLSDISRLWLLLFSTFLKNIERFYIQLHYYLQISVKIWWVLRRAVFHKTTKRLMVFTETARKRGCQIFPHELKLLEEEESFERFF